MFLRLALGTGIVGGIGNLQRNNIPVASDNGAAQGFILLLVTVIRHIYEIRLLFDVKVFSHIYSVILFCAHGSNLVGKKFMRSIPCTNR